MSAYYANRRLDVVGFLSAELDSRNSYSILELGGGEGAFAREISNSLLVDRYLLVDAFGGQTTGVPASQIELRHCDAVSFLVNDNREKFDLIIMNDFFEHILAGNEFMSALKSALDEGGSIFISCPNVGNARVIFDLIRGEFAYADEGVLDRTHLRFFTPKSLVDFFSSYGFRAQKVAPKSRYSESSGKLKSRFSYWLSGKGVFLFEHQFFCHFTM